MDHQANMAVGDIDNYKTVEDIIRQNNTNQIREDEKYYDNR